MRVVALSTCAASSSVSFTPKALLSPSRKHLLHYGCSLLSKSDRRWHSIGCSAKTPAVEHFGHSNNLVTYVTTTVNNLLITSTEPFKEFQWKKAQSMVAERLLILGQKALKWSFVFLFAVSFLSDILMAVSRNLDLMIPLGLFIGVVLADILKESSQVFFQTRIKDESFPRQLLGVGSIFVFIKSLALFFNVQGKMLLSLIGNGGLMQVLWLARELQQKANSERNKELDTPGLEA